MEEIIMRLKQWLIKQFGSKEFIENKLQSTYFPEEVPVEEPKAPDISPPAQELAEAIESGAIALYKNKEDKWITYYKHSGMYYIEFFYNRWDGTFNTINYAFTNDEAKLLAEALRKYNNKEILKNKAATRECIAVCLAKQAIDKL